MIPAEWKGFKARRIYRGTTYDIEVLNPDGVETGVKEIKFEGKRIEGNIIPVLNVKSCKVLVTLGF